MYLLRRVHRNIITYEGKLCKLITIFLGLYLNFVVPHNMPALGMQRSLAKNEATQVEEIRLGNCQNSALDDVVNLLANFTKFKHDPWELTVE